MTLAEINRLPLRRVPRARVIRTAELGPDQRPTIEAPYRSLEAEADAWAHELRGGRS